MNKWLVFLCGVLTGIVLMIIVSLIYVNNQGSNSDSFFDRAGSDDNVTLFNAPSDIVEDKEFEVFQVLSQDAALVHAKTSLDLYLGNVYLLTNQEGKYYYDDEKIKVPEGKVLRQIGIYRYPTRNDFIKTVPIIMVMDE